MGEGRQPTRCCIIGWLTELNTASCTLGWQKGNVHGLLAMPLMLSDHITLSKLKILEHLSSKAIRKQIDVGRQLTRCCIKSLQRELDTANCTLGWQQESVHGSMTMPLVLFDRITTLSKIKILEHLCSLAIRK